MSTTRNKAARHRSCRLLRAVRPVLLAGLTLAICWVSVTTAARAPADLSGATSYNPLVADIISQVTTPTLEYELAGLTGERLVTVGGVSTTIASRWSLNPAAISMATQYAYEQLAATGLPVTYHNYTWGIYDLRNVVAEKPGQVDADQIYLITAHIDTIRNEVPGADDDGSGCVTVLQAARLLASRHLAYTVRFVLFTGEEQYLRGSAAYAADCAARGEDIRGVVNLDMIAYNSDAVRAIDLGTDTSNPESIELAEVFSDTIGIYGLDLAPHPFHDVRRVPCSDDCSFTARGYPATLATEDWDDFNPYYHTVSDRLAALDLDYYADLTQAAIATIAHLACPLPNDDVGQLAGTVTDLETSQPLSGAVVAAFWPTYSYTFSTVTAADGTFTLPLPVANYTVTVTSRSHCAVTVTNVGIVTDTVTTLDSELAPWLRFYFPLIAHAD